MTYYVIPDIHGRNDLLQMALCDLYEDNPDGGKIIFLGDYIDRGPDNVGVLLTVMNPPEGWEFITLKGNHEAMMVGGYYQEHPVYDEKVFKEIMGSQALTVPVVVDWIQTLPIFHFEDDNVFAHASYDDHRAPKDQLEHNVLWDRYEDHEAYRSNDDRYYLIHGHTPRKHGPLIAQNRLNLDCGAVFYGRLVVAEFEEGKRGPQGFLEYPKPS